MYFSNLVSVNNDNEKQALNHQHQRQKFWLTPPSGFATWWEQTLYEIALNQTNWGIQSNSYDINLFLTFPACFWIPIIFSNLNLNCSNKLDMMNLQEQVKKAICCQKLFWPFTVWINCSNDLKIFSHSWPSALIFLEITRKIFSHSSSEQLS